ncbi:MAG TPA: phospholipase, partial [Flavobacteriaceae bacterium]|nr:phospholipase [Flavobacteriaceae bacterium]
MNKKISRYLLAVTFVIGSICQAQSIKREKFKDSVQQLPYFTIHKDNFFLTGVPTNTSINSSSADAKYQVSFKQIITRDKLPWDTYLFLTYTQQAFWDIYEES